MGPRSQLGRAVVPHLLALDSVCNGSLDRMRKRRSLLFDEAPHKRRSIIDVSLRSF